ncbi:flippase [Candidatus Woesearchaeota archaeon]|nr:flippase [Candidatus Woesearchaeota archaeon]
MSTLKRIARNAGFVFIGDNALKILTMILVFLIARYLGVEEYGKFSFVISFTGLFFIVLDLGTRILIVREIAQNKAKASKIISNVIILKILSSVFVYAFIIILAFLLNYEKAVIYGVAIAALGIIFDSLSSTFESVFQAYERMEFPAFTKITRVLIRFIVTMPFLLKGSGFFPVLIIFVLAQFLNFLISFILCFKVLVKPIFDFDKKFTIGLVKRAFPFLLSGIFVTVYFRIDVTLMSKLAPETLAGVYNQVSRDAVIGWYSAAYNILDGLISIPIAVSFAILPVAVIYFKESKLKLTRLYQLSIKYLTYLSLPIAVGVTMLAPKLVILLYKDKYLNSIFALQILIWTIVPVFINYMLGAIMTAIHKEKEGLYILFANAIINILLNLVLIPKFSLYGAAVSTVLTEIFYFSGYYYIISKNLGRISFVNIIAKPLLACVLMGLLIYYLYYMNIFVLILIGAATYFISMYLLRAFSEEDMDVIKKLVKIKNV